jgi:hypothetical protein
MSDCYPLCRARRAALRKARATAKLRRRSQEPQAVARRQSRRRAHLRELAVLSAKRKAFIKAAAARRRAVTKESTP